MMWTAWSVPLISRPATGEQGGAAVELTLLAPVLMLVIGFIVVTGRLALASMDVRQAAAAAARAASVTQTSSAAAAAARAEAIANLTAAGVSCGGPGIAVEADMRPGSNVAVTVVCPVALADLDLLGLPDTRTVSARAIEPVDLHRASGS
jgi:Flp pilus assembly protein TadG